MIEEASQRIADRMFGVEHLVMQSDRLEDLLVIVARIGLLAIPVLSSCVYDLALATPADCLRRGESRRNLPRPQASSMTLP